jgi:hypothetical protein
MFESKAEDYLSADRPLCQFRIILQAKKVLPLIYLADLKVRKKKV